MKAVVFMANRSRFVVLQSSALQSEDIDLSDIFADYFTNEFEDPMNAYTNSMANAGYATGIMEPGRNPTAHMQRQGDGNLPTGGIRTAYHGLGSTTVEPLQKRPKQEQPGVALLQQHHAAAIMNSMQAASGMPPSVGSTPLPFGVGIRLGGMGGVVPGLNNPSVPPFIGVPGMQVPWMIQNTNNNRAGIGMHDSGPPQEYASTDRRLRNREHAKRSRVRKKFMLEAMQADVRQLQRENQGLRLLVQEHIPEHAMKIISECCSTSPLFSDDDSKGQHHGKEDELVKSDYALMQSLTAGQQCFCLSDPKLPDNPIVFASPGFYKLTGYTAKSVLGRNCRFLQGPGTNQKAVDVIRKAVLSGSDATVCLLNYKADGSPFWNQFFLAALRDSDNQIVNYVSISFSPEPMNTVFECSHGLSLSLSCIRSGSNAKLSRKLAQTLWKTR
jgi:PAS domain S-box-containing protein